jgi:hypothetical protein
MTPLKHEKTLLIAAVPLLVFVALAILWLTGAFPRSVRGSSTTYQYNACGWREERESAADRGAALGWTDRVQAGGGSGYVLGHCT